jgi:hypothetical protein
VRDLRRSYGKVTVRIVADHFQELPMETPYLAQKPAIDAALLWQSLNQHFHEVLPLPMVQPRKHLKSMISSGARAN